MRRLVTGVVAIAIVSVLAASAVSVPIGLLNSDSRVGDSDSFTMADGNSPPTISMPSSDLVKQKVTTTFNVTASDPDGDALRFTWIWGDGAISVTETITASHTYIQKTTLTLVVWADDQTGLEGHNVSAAEHLTIVPTADPPTVTAFTVKGLTAGITALTGQPLNFSGSAKDSAGDAMTFEFKFGDGTWYNQSNPEKGNNVIVTNWVMHSFAEAGIFTACLYVFDGVYTSQSAARTIAVTVNDKPDITPQANKTGAMGVAMAFSGAAFDPDGDPLRFSWNFGDGTPMVVGQNVMHAYTTPGAFAFTLFVDDLTGIPGHNVSSSATANIGWRLNLASGWNLFTVPILSNYTAGTLPLAMGDEVVGWNPMIQSYDRVFIKGVSPPYMDFPIVPSHGYWVWVGAARTITLYGTVATATQTRTITVSAGGGWALIGLCSLYPLWRASDIPVMFSGPGHVSMVVKYTPPGVIPPIDPLYTTYIPGLPLNNFILVPGQAYWIFVTGSGTLSYDPSGPGIGPVG